jgi:hypothetical protein
MAFTVVYDANVLYPNTLRDLLGRERLHREDVVGDAAVTRRPG